MQIYILIKLVFYASSLILEEVQENAIERNKNNQKHSIHKNPKNCLSTLLLVTKIVIKRLCYY